MCGIAGTFAYSGSAPAVDREELRAVRDHMRARGPDGEGEWYSADGRVGLTHRRLAIIDLSPSGAQPMASADGTVVITFNGEIYNHRELRASLEQRGRVFRSQSDTEVLLHLYDEHGESMFDRLRGMYAMAIWDARKSGVLLARDPLGIKPLYYADDGHTLRFASQVKALLQARVDRSPEPAGHAGFFLWGSVPAPWTLYRGIRALPAGHTLWVDGRGASQPRSFCDIADVLGEAARQPAGCSEAEALERIAHALRSSVAAHCVADVPVGVFLSAGLDSGIIASLVREGGARPRTVTLGFEEYAGRRDDEVPLAETVARQLGTVHSTVMVRQSDFDAQRDRLLAAMDQPSIDGVNTWFVARAAASQGLKVALSGLGGDELFASYPSFAQIPRMVRLCGAWRERRRTAAALRWVSEPLVASVTSPKYAGLLEYGGTAGGAYLLRRGLYMPWELPRILGPDIAREGWQRLQPIASLDACVEHAGGKADRMAVSALEMSFYMRHQLLNDADWAGMAHGLEIRVPFADLQLLKAIAPVLAARPQITKRQVAQAAARQLPTEVLHKPKSGFMVPVREWMGAAVAQRPARGMRGWALDMHEHYAG